MKVRTYTYNIRSDPTTKAWLERRDDNGWVWTCDKATAWRLSGQEAERLRNKVKYQYPNALLEAASKRVDWAKPEIESGFD